MYNIEEYIEKSKSIPNTSDGGSPAFHFDDVVLIKYECESEYGDPRTNAEEIAKIANEKRKRGVNTPYHYAIKRETVDNHNICWVLQEKAPGKCLGNHNIYGDPKVILERQKRLVVLDNKIFEKAVLDISELYYMGLEIKGKNIYLDNQKGFWFFDLIVATEEKLNFDDFSELLRLKNDLSFTLNDRVESYNEAATQEQLDESTELYLQLFKKNYDAMSQVIPTFQNHKKKLLGIFNQDEINYLKTHGSDVGELSLSEEEYAFFNKELEDIIRELLAKLISGKATFSNLIFGDIRNLLEEKQLYYYWRFHKENDKPKESFYQLADSLNELVVDEFSRRIKLLNETNDNEYLKEAAEMMERMNRVNK